MKTIDDTLEAYRVELSSSASSTIDALDLGQLARANELLRLLAVGLALDDLTLLTQPEQAAASTTSSIRLDGFELVYRSDPAHRSAQVLVLRAGSGTHTRH